MTLTNAEKQKRWRDKRNILASALVGTPREIADSILHQLGSDKAQKIARTLNKRLRNLRPDCQRCNGSGFFTRQTFSPCGTTYIGDTTWPCDCNTVEDREEQFRTTILREINGGDPPEAA